MLTPQQINASAIERYASPYADRREERSAFTAGANFAQEANRKELQQLVEDYERRLKGMAGIPAMDREEAIAMDTKTELYRSIIADLNRLLNPAGTGSK